MIDIKIIKRPFKFPEYLCLINYHITIPEIYNNDISISLRMYDAFFNLRVVFQMILKIVKGSLYNNNCAKTYITILKAFTRVKGLNFRHCVDWSNKVVKN